MKEKNWYEQHGWYWDKRDHMWKKQVIGGTSVPKSKEAILHDRYGPKKGNTQTPFQNSKPFTKKYGIYIFDNVQYPLKLHEVMWRI